MKGTQSSVLLLRECEDHELNVAPKSFGEGFWFPKYIGSKKRKIPTFWEMEGKVMGSTHCMANPI